MEYSKMIETVFEQNAKDLMCNSRDFSKDGFTVISFEVDEKSQNRIHDDKEKQDAFVQMLRRKKMKGLVDE